MDWRITSSRSAGRADLREDPARMHASQTSPRVTVRHVVETSRGQHASEPAVRAEAIALAQTAAAQCGMGSQRARRLFPGRQDGPWSVRWVRVSWRGGRAKPACPTCPSISAHRVVTALAKALCSCRSKAPGRATGAPGSLRSPPRERLGAGVALVNCWSRCLLPPRALPRLDFSRGIRRRTARW